MSRGKGQAPLRSRHSSKCLGTAHSNPLDPPRPVLSYFWGLAIPEHTFPGPYRPIIEAPRIPTTTQVKSRYKCQGWEVTDTTIARKKRRALLGSFSRFWLIPGCEAREFTLYTKLCHTDHALIINHKTLLCNRSLDHMPLRRGTQAIHSMRLIAVNT